MLRDLHKTSSPPKLNRTSDFGLGNAAVIRCGKNARNDENSRLAIQFIGKILKTALLLWRGLQEGGPLASYASIDVLGSVSYACAATRSDR